MIIIFDFKSKQKQNNIIILIFYFTSYPMGYAITYIMMWNLIVDRLNNVLSFPLILFTLVTLTTMRMLWSNHLIMQKMLPHPSAK